MKTLRLSLLLVVSLLVTNVSVFGYVVAPKSADATTSVENAADRSTTKTLGTKELKKQQKKEARAQKRAERQAKFLEWFTKKLADSNEQLIAIILVIFVGGLGIHRVYLQSKPIIILWYFLTLGGFFGIIPLIDLIRLAIGQVDHYKGNSSLFRAFQSA